MFEKVSTCKVWRQIMIVSMSGFPRRRGRDVFTGIDIKLPITKQEKKLESGDSSTLFQEWNVVSSHK